MTFDNYQIRLLTENDLLPYFTLVETNRKRLEDFFTGTVSKTKTLEDTKAFLAEIAERTAGKKYFPYIIIDSGSEKIAGFIDVKNIDWQIPKAELGCYVDFATANKGLSTKALNIVIDHLFNELAFRKLFLRTHESNIAARTLAEKCGFRIEGTIRQDYKTTSGEIIDLLYYGRLNDDVLKYAD